MTFGDRLRDLIRFERAHPQPVVLVDGDFVRYYCPGCRMGHEIDARRWKFNGDRLHPTFEPSVKVTYGRRGDRICHSFVVGGNIRFLSDCTHDLAGQTVPMEPEDDD